MVDEKTIKETLTLLKVTYPTALKDLDKDTALAMIKVWLNDFKDTNKEIFLQAINNIRNKSEFFPNVSQIKKEIALLQTSEIPKAEEEWQEVISAVHRYGSYREQEALNSLNEYTRKIVELIGYYRICTSTQEEQTWNKKEFIGEYNAMKDKQIENIQIGVEEKKMLNG